MPLHSQCPDGTPPPCASRTARAAAAPANAVAVLYFENATRDSADAYLADGLTEEVITRLSGIERLTVRSRYVVRRYRGTDIEDPAAVGRALNVSYLVSGSIRRSGGRLRVNAELIRADTRAQVWGRQFDQQGDDVFAIQEAVASEVASGIVGRLLPAEREVIAVRPTRNAAAYDQYLRGNFAMARRDSLGLARAIRFYGAALETDSTFTDALSRISLVYGLASGNGTALGDVPADSLPARAMHYATEAVRRAPQSAEAWIAMALARKAVDPRHLTGAREAGERAVALAPDNAEAHHQLAVTLAWLGDWDGSNVHAHRALALEPNRPITISNLAVGAGRRGAWGEVVQWADSALSVDPDFVYAHVYRLVGLLQLGNRDAVSAELARWKDIPSLRPVVPVYELLLRTAPGDSAAIRNYRESVIAPRRRLAAGAGANWAEAVMITTRDSEGALMLLERIAPRGAQLGAYLDVPTFAPLRGNPRFQQLLAESTP